jgi:hypothetical protein
VATSVVLSTIDGCKTRKHVIAADSPSTFAQATCYLLENPEMRQKYSIVGKDLARQQPTWEDSTFIITQALSQLCKKNRHINL